MSIIVYTAIPIIQTLLYKSFHYKIKADNDFEVAYTFGNFQKRIITMKPEQIKKLTTEQLKKRASSYKTMIGIFIPIILGLSYFVIRDYIREGSMDMPLLIIDICTVGGMISLFPELNSLRKELEDRGF